MSLRQKLRTPVLRAASVVMHPLWRGVWRDHVEFLWYASRNWGDALNPILVRLIAERPAHGIDLHMRALGVARSYQPYRHAVVGSTLQLVDEATVVWGAGFESADSTLAARPARVCAVRGPLSAAKLRAMGVECPAVFGDPALLYPRYYQPRQKGRYRLGVIPHYVDCYSPKLEGLRQDDSVRIIDVRGGVQRVMDELASCEAIASSSLHGLIMADAYRVPSVWVKLSSDIRGEDFKFLDYFASQGESKVHPKWIGTETTADELMEASRLRDMAVDLEQLLDACPFRAGSGGH